MAPRAHKRLGYTVVAHPSATDAPDAVRANPAAFDVVISDLTTPGLTGAQLAVELRALRPDHLDHLDRLDPATTESLHVRKLLLKPYTTDALAAAVHRALLDARA